MNPAVLQLLVASLFWGFGFIAAIWALESIDAFEITFLRFFLAAVAGLAIGWRSLSKKPSRGLLALSFWPAVLLGLTLIFQTWGLKFTTATKCGFITTLYVVFVPFLEAWHGHRKISRTLWVAVGLALLGTLFIVNVGLKGSVNLGDVLTLIAALFATFQIYVVGLISPRVDRPFLFNAFQSVWVTFLTLPFLFHDGLLNKVGQIGSWPGTAVLGILSLAFGSTTLAFYLQVKAQAHLSPTVASLLCLLESPFALFFAMALLGESLGPLEAIGAMLIFLAAVLASVAKR